MIWIKPIQRADVLLNGADMVMPRTFNLLLIDEAGAVTSVERFVGVTEREVRRIAEKRALAHHRVEWDGPRLLHRRQRG